MAYIYRNVSLNIQQKIDTEINNINKIYFRNLIEDKLIYKGKCKHIIRYIIYYYISSYKLINKYSILQMDLLDFLEYNFNDCQSQFLLKVFNRSYINDILYIYNDITIVYMILNNLSYKTLVYFKDHYCGYYIYKNCLL
jgi:hypothetical protein